MCSRRESGKINSGLLEPHFSENELVRKMSFRTLSFSYENKVRIFAKFSGLCLRGPEFRKVPATSPTFNCLLVSEFFLPLMEFRGESTVSSSQPNIACPKQTHLVLGKELL